MYKGKNENVLVKALVCDAVVSKPREEIPLNRRNYLFCTWPNRPYAWTLDNRVESALNFSNEILSEPIGALLVPIGRLDDLGLCIRVYDELHDASAVRSGCCRAQFAMGSAQQPHCAHPQLSSGVPSTTPRRVRRRQRVQGFRAGDARASRVRRPEARGLRKGGAQQLT